MRDTNPVHPNCFEPYTHNAGARRTLHFACEAPEPCSKCPRRRFAPTPALLGRRSIPTLSIIAIASIIKWARSFVKRRSAKSIGGRFTGKQRRVDNSSVRIVEYKVDNDIDGESNEKDHGRNTDHSAQNDTVLCDCSRNRVRNLLYDLCSPAAGRNPKVVRIANGRIHRKSVSL